MPEIYKCRQVILNIVQQAGLLATVFQWKGNHPQMSNEETQKSIKILQNLKPLIQNLEQLLTKDTPKYEIDIQLPEIKTTFSQLTFEELRQEINQWCHQRDWEQYHTPKNLVMAMIGEVAELSEIFIEGEFQPGLPELNQQKKHHAGEEIADILHNLIRLCDRCNIDIVTAIKQKIQKNSIKYPVDKVKGSSQKYDEYQK